MDPSDPNLLDLNLLDILGEPPTVFNTADDSPGDAWLEALPADPAAPTSPAAASTVETQQQQRQPSIDLGSVLERDLSAAAAAAAAADAVAAPLMPPMLAGVAAEQPPYVATAAPFQPGTSIGLWQQPCELLSTTANSPTHQPAGWIEPPQPSCRAARAQPHLLQSSTQAAPVSAIQHLQAVSSLLHSSDPAFFPAALPSTGQAVVCHQAGQPTRAWLTAVTTSTTGEDAALPVYTLSTGARHKLVFAGLGPSREGGVRYHRYSLPEDDELVSSTGRFEAPPNSLLVASVYDPSVQVLLALSVGDHVLIFWRQSAYRARWDWVSWTTAQEFRNLKFLGAVQLAVLCKRCHSWSPV
jgi:hypothetical protein